jgi:hypothetical protein
MPRLPLASRADILYELDLIEAEREAKLSKPVTSQEGLDNWLATQAEWEQELRDQLEAMPPTEGSEP